MIDLGGFCTILVIEAYLWVWEWSHFTTPCREMYLGKHGGRPEASKTLADHQARLPAVRGAVLATCVLVLPFQLISTASTRGMRERLEVIGSPLIVAEISLEENSV